MITSFQVTNFRSIRSLELDMRPFMVFVGPNGSGKTNILHALELFGELVERGTTEPLRERGWDQILRRRSTLLSARTSTTRPPTGGARAASNVTFRVKVQLPSRLLEEPERVEGSAFHLELAAELRWSREADDVEIVREEASLQTAADAVRIFISGGLMRLDRGQGKLLGLVQRRSGTLGLWRELSDPRHIDTAPVFFLLRRLALDPFGRHAVNLLRVLKVRLDTAALRGESSGRHPHRDVLGTSGEGLGRAVDRLRSREPATFKRVLMALQRVYPRIEDVRARPVEPGRLGLYFKERGVQGELAQSHVSDGVLHALAILVLLKRRRLLSADGVLAVEEPENAIHPWAIRTMIEDAQAQLRRQVLLTTHSETVVNAVRDPDALFIVENDDKRGTIVTPAREREAALDAILRETGQRLGDVWMGGSLGGVPQAQP